MMVKTKREVLMLLESTLHAKDVYCVACWTPSNCTGGKHKVANGMLARKTAWLGIYCQMIPWLCYLKVSVCVTGSACQVLAD